MEALFMEPFQVIGITVRTTNQNAQAANDIQNLWERFINESILEKIPNKISPSIYSIYKDYDGDYMQPYTTLLGCKVSSILEVPEGMEYVTMHSGNYRKFTAEGDLNNGIVYQSWLDIWKMDLERSYTTDYEVYGPKAQDPSDAVVDIFIAVKD